MNFCLHVDSRRKSGSKAFVCIERRKGCGIIERENWLLVEPGRSKKEKLAECILYKTIRYSHIKKSQRSNSYKTSILFCLRCVIQNSGFKRSWELVGEIHLKKYSATKKSHRTLLLDPYLYKNSLLRYIAITFAHLK